MPELPMRAEGQALGRQVRIVPLIAARTAERKIVRIQRRRRRASRPKA